MHLLRRQRGQRPAIVRQLIGAALALAGAWAFSVQVRATNPEPQSFTPTTFAPGFTQELVGVTQLGVFPGPDQIPVALGGLAFAPNGDLWAAECTFTNTVLHRFALSQPALSPVHDTPTLHAEVATVPSVGGCGLTNWAPVPSGPFSLFSNSSAGVYQLDAATGAVVSPALGQPGNGLGIAVDPKTNHVVYAGADCHPTLLPGSPTCTIWDLDPTTGGTTMWAQTDHARLPFVDGIYFEPLDPSNPTLTGDRLFVANRDEDNGQNLLSILRRPVLPVTGVDNTQIVQDVLMSSEPDGVAFHATAPKFVLTNDEFDPLGSGFGTLTRFDFPGDDYSQLPIPVSAGLYGSRFGDGGFRGDLSQVGPDGCLYVTQGRFSYADGFGNLSKGTRYNDSFEDTTDSIVRICGNFAIPPGVPDTHGGTVGPHLKLVKQVTNDNGGTATAADFTLTATGPTTLSGAGTAEGDVTAGTYTLAETNLTGYTAGSWSCTAGTLTGASLVLANGDNAVCTITNDDTPASLTLVKIVDNRHGGTKQPSDFTLTATGPAGALSGPGPSVSNTHLSTGTYALSEAGPVGYTASAWSCVGGTQSGATIALALGESATCTITNSDQAAHLTLAKTVTNDNGGTAAATAWTLTATGAAASISGTTGSAAVTNAAVAAGTYALAESGPTGYTAGSWVCTGSGTQAGASIALALGQTATCTINNDDQAAHLKLIKTVDNQFGGSAVAASFTLTAAGPTPLAGAGGAESDVNAGVYTLSESSLPGYTASAWSCVGGSLAGATLTLANGQSAVCTITNHDRPAHLKLVKTVTNDNGGTAVPTAFTLSATGPTPLSGAGGAESDVNAGSYTLSETSLPGYSAGPWSCVGGSLAGSSLTLGLGQSATCTITNDDQPAHLIVNKVVINNDGGTATAASFSGTIGGTVVATGGNTWAGVSTDRVLTTVGTYNVTESAVAGYTASFSVGCSGTIALGETKICTVTNDDQPAHLIVNKVVINNDGGTATAASFSGTIGGTVVATGGNTWAGASTDRVLTTVGTYTVTEAPVAGYTAAFSAGCSGTIALGETKTCTVTNDDQPAHLIVNKIVINNDGGTATAASFSGTIGGTVVATGGNTWAGASTDRVLTTVGSYNVTEAPVAGYVAAFSADCSGTIALGETKTCTVTNDDQPAHLIVNKIVINNDGGTATAASFSGTIGGTVVATGGNTWAGASTDRVLTTVGSYNVTEAPVAGYTAAFSAGCSGTIALGETKICTVTNDDQPAHLIVNKIVVNNNGGSLTAASFSGTIGGTVVATGGNTWAGASTDRVLTTVGTYNVTEGAVAGYTASFSATCSGTIALGETKTCTVTNDDQPAHLIVNKIVINNNGGSLTAASFSGTIGGTVVATGGNTWAGASTDRVLTTVGTYNVTEGAVAGYTASFSATCSGTIALGETKTCTVTNDDQPATLTVIKHVINNNGGTAVAANFTLTASGAAISGGSAAAPGSETGTVRTVNAGAYSVSETTLPNYLQTSAIGCTGTLAPGGSATCTIVNDDQPQPGLSIVKTANTATYTSVGQTIVYTYTVTNTGGVTLPGPFTVTDDKLGSFACGSGSLAPGASLTCTKNYVIQPKDLGTVLSLPTGVPATVDTGAWFGGVMSSQDTTISNAGPGVPNGIYPGWCIQDWVPTDLHNQTGTLYSTIGGNLPADVAVIMWGKVNWVLNHKIRAAGATDTQFFKDVQTAIWVSVGEQNPEFGISATAQQMITDANLHQNFVPGPGDVVAVIIYSDGMTIFPGSIQESIIEMKPLQSITNDAVVTTPGVTSPHTHVTVNQVLPPKFVTYTQGGWGAPPNGNNPGALLAANFSTVYPTGVTIGITGTANRFYLKFTSAAAIQAFLPAGGTPKALKASATNPTTSGAGVFAGQVLALRLAVDFSNAGKLTAGLGGLKIAPGNILAGQTVTQVLAAANTALGGGGLPAGVSSMAALNDLVTRINENYDGGTVNKGLLVP